MAGYTRQDGNAMRRDAMRRAQQMQQRVPYRKPPDDIDAYLPFQEETAGSEPEPRSEHKPKKEPSRPGDSPPKKGGFLGGGFSLPGGIDRLLEQAGSDRMLILALLAMIYKDGGSKKLMMALAYLLT